MAWSERTSEGFLIAATVAGDRNARRAITQLAGDARAQTRALIASLEALDDAERRARIMAITDAARRPLEGASASLSPRVLGLLAPLARRELGQRWLAQSPPPRTGFRAEPGLRAVLRMIAERSS